MIEEGLNRAAVFMALFPEESYECRNCGCVFLVIKSSDTICCPQCQSVMW